MLNRDREREILCEYEAVLTEAQTVLMDAEAKFVGAQREVDELRAIVDRLRIRVDDKAVETDTKPPVEVASGIAAASNGPTRYRGRTSLPHFVLTLMDDGQRRTINQIMDTVRAAPEFAAQPPNRNTLATRLSELAKKGRLTKHPDRSYQKLPPAEPSDSGAFERADQTVANPG